MLFLLTLGISAHTFRILHGIWDCICGQLEGLGFFLIIVIQLWAGGLVYGSENGFAVSPPDFCIRLFFIRTCLALISDLYVVSVLSGSNRLFESRPPYKWRIMILTLCLVAIIIKNWRFIFT